MADDKGYTNEMESITIPVAKCNCTPDECPDWAQCVNNNNYICTQIEEV